MEDGKEKTMWIPGTVEQTKPNADDIKKMEDAIVETIEAMEDLRRATVYFYLHASGMTLDKAKDIRRKAGATQ